MELCASDALCDDGESGCAVDAGLQRCAFACDCDGCAGAVDASATLLEERAAPFIRHAAPRNQRAAPLRHCHSAQRIRHTKANSCKAAIDARDSMSCDNAERLVRTSESGVAERQSKVGLKAGCSRHARREEAKQGSDEIGGEVDTVGVRERVSEAEQANVTEPCCVVAAAGVAVCA